MGFISDIVEGVVDFFEDIFEAVVDVFSSIFSAIGSAVSGIFGGLTPDVPTPNSGATSPDGVVLTKAGSNLDIPVVYGHRRVGGRIVYAETNGTLNSSLFVVYAICEGEIDGVKKIFVDDNQLPLPSGNNKTYQVGNATTHKVTTGKYADRMRFQIFNGTETQEQSTLAAEGKNWRNKERKMPGVAYAVFEFIWKPIESQEDADNNPYRGGIPQVKFDVNGKKVFNVINHTGGVDLASDYAGLTKTFSYNPVSCTLDYLMNPRYGAGLDRTEINADAFKTAAIKCNQKVTYATGQTGKALLMNAVVSMQPKIIDNVKTLLSGARGFLPYIQGRYKLILEDGGNATDITSSTLTSAFDVTTDHIIGSISMQGEQKQNKFNQVIVRYVDPEKNFTEQQVVHTESADVTADGEDLIGDFQFFTISNPNIAKDIARMIYKKSRSQRFINFTATPELLAVEPGDIIRITSDVLNLSTQTFRVTNMSFTGGGNVSIQAREHDATLYPFVSGEQIEIPAKLYKPDSFTLTPTPENPNRKHIGVVPPDDGEPIVTDPTPDSVGNPSGEEDPGDDNDLPVLIKLPPPNVIGTFASVFSADGNDLGYVVMPLGNPKTVYKDIFVDFPTPAPFGLTGSCLLFPPLNQGTPTFADRIVNQGKSPFDAMPSPGGQILFKIFPPYGSHHGRLTLKIDLIDRQTNAIRDTRILGLFQVTGRGYAQCFLPGVRSTDFARVRFFQQHLNKEYIDGSSSGSGSIFLAIPDYTGFTFTNLDGNTETGFNLEAALNNYIQNDTRFAKFAANAGSSTSSQSSSENLGG